MKPAPATTRVFLCASHQRRCGMPQGTGRTHERQKYPGISTLQGKMGTVFPDVEQGRTMPKVATAPNIFRAFQRKSYCAMRNMVGMENFFSAAAKRSGRCAYHPMLVRRGASTYACNATYCKQIPVKTHFFSLRGCTRHFSRTVSSAWWKRIGGNPCRYRP